MAGSFLDCVLRAAGKLPPDPGGGPKGGGGDGTGGDGGGGDPDPCEEKFNYYSCIKPTKYADDDNNDCGLTQFTAEELRDLGLITSCDDIANIPNQFDIGEVTYYRNKNLCESTCNLADKFCPGFFCPPGGNPGCLTQQNILSIRDNWQNSCFTDNGETSECIPLITKNGCLGTDGKTYYNDLILCDSSEAECIEESCLAHYCIDPECPGNCTGTKVIGEFSDPVCYEEICLPGGFDCFDAALQKTIYKNKGDCDPTCEDFGTCEKFTCVTSECVEGGPLGNCCPTETVSSDPNSPIYDANCACDGTYNDSGDPNVYADQLACRNACIDCPDGFKCQPTDQCEQDPTGCDGEWIIGSDPIDCKYSGGATCYDTVLECDNAEESCQCPSIVVCDFDFVNGIKCTICTPETVGIPEAGGCVYRAVDNDDNQACEGIGDQDGWVCPGFDQSTCLPQLNACNAVCNNLDASCLECEVIDTPCIQTCRKEFSSNAQTLICPTNQNCFDDQTACDNFCSTPKEDCWECVEVEDQGGSVRKRGGKCLQTQDCERLPNGKCPTGCQVTEKQCILQNVNCLSSIPPELKETLLTTDNEDGNSLGFTPSQLRQIYGIEYIDPVIDRTESNYNYAMPKKFMPVDRGSLRSDLFNSKVHAPIKAIHLMNRKKMPFSDFPYSSLSDKAIEQSLYPNLVILMKSAKGADGTPIYRHIINSIREAIIADRVDLINVVELTDILNRIITAQNTDEYKKTRGEFDAYKGTKSRESKAIDLVLENSHPYSYKKYTTRIAERMRLWKTVAVDLAKHIPVRRQDGTTSKLTIAKDDSFPVIVGGVAQKGYINDGDYVNVINSEGKTIKLEVAGDHDRAGVIDLEILQKALYLLGDDYEFNLKVTNDPSVRSEDLYNTTTALERSIMLKLKPDTIEDLPRKNQFVSRTRANYEYVSKIADRDAWVKYKPWPYMVFHVDHEDPILGYIKKSTTIEVTTKDFTLDTIDAGDMPLYPRRLPWTIVIIPTDRTSHLPYRGISKFLEYGQRELKLYVHPDPNRSNTWEAPHLQQTYADDLAGVSREKNPQALAFDYTGNKVAGLTRYISNTSNEEPLPRRKFGVRRVLETLKKLKDHYDVNDTVTTWGEVYSRIDPNDMKFLYVECLNWINTKTRIMLGKVSSDEDVNALYVKPIDKASEKTKVYDTKLDRFRTNLTLVEIDLEENLPDEPEIP